MRIRCIILRRNRTLRISHYKQERGFFRFNKGIYLLRKEDVNLYHNEDKKIKYIPKPELYFIEGHPIPIGIKDVETGEVIEIEDSEGNKIKIPRITKASAFLDKLVISNALREVGKPRGLMWEVMADYVKNPFNVFMLVIAFIVFVSFIVNLELP